MNSFLFGVKQKLLFVFRAANMILQGGTECIVCGNSSGMIPLCRKCRESLYDTQEVLSRRRCSVCGKELVSEDELCMECRKKKIFENSDRVIPLYDYRLWNKELLFRWKIQEERTLSAFFAEKIYYAVKDTGCQVVVPVPPRKGKIRKKGWDQVDEVCQFLEFRYGLEVLRVLERVSAQEQKKLDRSSRLETIGKSFSLVPEEKLEGILRPYGGSIPSSVCLVDDILTTGATAESCSAILKQGGAGKVFVVTLFIAG